MVLSSDNNNDRCFLTAKVNGVKVNFRVRVMFKVEIIAKMHLTNVHNKSHHAHCK